MKTCYIFPESRTIADLVAPGELHVGWVITRINVPFTSRGQGLGTKILKEIIADADAEAVDLWVQVSPSDGLDFNQLMAWYYRHGFRIHEPTGYLVRRWRHATA